MQFKVSTDPFKHEVGKASRTTCCQVVIDLHVFTAAERKREREREKPKGTTVDSGMSLQLAACCVCTHVGLQHAAVEVPCATACRLMAIACSRQAWEAIYMHAHIQASSHSIH